MDYLEKYQENPFPDLAWNIPEDRTRGSIAILGGSLGNFRTSVKITEFLNNNSPVKELKTVLPDSLKPTLPKLDNLVFLSSTDNGTFKDAAELESVIDSVDFTLSLGDFSKNAVTKKALDSAYVSSAKPLLITRDAVDLAIGPGAQQLLMREGLTIIASVVQWQKLLRAVFYPKMLMPSQSLVQVADVFHKLTLTYPVQAVSFHDGQIIIAKSGRVALVPLEKSHQTVLTLWNGELAASIAVMNLFNPGKFLEATVSAIFG